MNVQVLYCYPMVQNRKYYPLAIRFAETYQRFPAGHEHQLVVLCNGSAGSQTMMRMFDNIPHETRVHSNIGWDIGAYQRVADTSTADLMVCLGAHCHFYRADWLKAMVDAYLEHGVGLYGCTAYGGIITHVRTTVFWIPPELFRSYPNYIGSSRRSRYEFEHGGTSLTHHVLNLGFPCVMVTSLGSFVYPDWHDHAPGFNEILVRDQHIHDPTSRMDK